MARPYIDGGYWREGYVIGRSYALMPLRKSHAVDDLENELRLLFIEIYEKNQLEQADEINVYGAPHLGSKDLIARHVTADGLSVLGGEDDAAVRHLFKAWRHRNPKRGFHFLRTYLRALWGENYVVDQLWQRKDSPYPTALTTIGDIRTKGESETDYYLTSRVRVDLDTDIVADRVIKSLTTSVAARFLMKVRIAKFFSKSVGVSMINRPSVIVRVAGTAEPASGIKMRTGSVFGASNVVYGLTE